MIKIMVAQVMQTNTILTIISFFISQIYNEVHIVLVTKVTV